MLYKSGEKKSLQIKDVGYEYANSLGCDGLRAMKSSSFSLVHTLSGNTLRTKPFDLSSRLHVFVEWELRRGGVVAKKSLEKYRGKERKEHILRHFIISPDEATHNELIVGGKL